MLNDDLGARRSQFLALLGKSSLDGCGGSFWRADVNHDFLRSCHVDTLIISADQLGTPNYRGCGAVPRGSSCRQGTATWG